MYGGCPERKKDKFVNTGFKVLQAVDTWENMRRQEAPESRDSRNKDTIIRIGYGCKLYKSLRNKYKFRHLAKNL